MPLGTAWLIWPAGLSALMVFLGIAVVAAGLGYAGPYVPSEKNTELMASVEALGGLVVIGVAAVVVGSATLTCIGVWYYRA